ncbi:MAG: DUF192 domain-containing protein [Candidatus Obscuribacterales bacterium]
MRKIILTLCLLASLMGFEALAGEIEAKMPTAKIGSNVITLEVAQTLEEIQRGLMFRTSLEKDSGMVFLFPRGYRANFWMKNTLIPLDMLFILDGKVVKIFENVPPAKEKDDRKIPHYPAGEGIEVSEVIEVNAGYCAKHNVKEGDTVEFSMR